MPASTVTCEAWVGATYESGGFSMVWARTRNCHAVHHDLRSFVTQAMQHRDGGQFSVRTEADPWRIGYDLRSVAALCLRVWINLAHGCRERVY